jgi:hypothetical protein
MPRFSKLELSTLKHKSRFDTSEGRDNQHCNAVNKCLRDTNPCVNKRNKKGMNLSKRENKKQKLTNNQTNSLSTQIPLEQSLVSRHM